MIRREIAEFDVAGKNYRDVCPEMDDFINSSQCREGCILVLFGLRRTGKTTLMEQVAVKNCQKEKCAFYKLSDGDSIADVEKKLWEEKEKGTTLVFLDEITLADDFISNSSTLPDIFAKAGMKIVVTGTDSLGFLYAEERELFDRTIFLRTTHIPFAEHCRVLGVNDMDDYIKYGGLMSKGKKTVYDVESAKKYLDSSVADNIANSIKKDIKSSHLEALSNEEIRTVIEKMVESYSGNFDKKIMREELKKATITFPIDRIPEEISDMDIIKRLNLKRDNIRSDFLKTINADGAITHEVTDNMVLELERHLRNMNVLSVTLKATYDYGEEGWQERWTGNERGGLNPDKYDYHIIQPAIKYWHLQEAKDFMEREQYFSELSPEMKKAMQDKLEEKIFGDMTEQIVLFDTGKALPVDRYEVVKPIFTVEGRSKGEYDMLIHDKKENKYWGFEIKHTTNPYSGQEKHLLDGQIREVIDQNYGGRENVCVLYRGKPFQNNTGTCYINITDFSLAVDRYRDMDRAMKELTKDLPSRNLEEEKAGSLKTDNADTVNFDSTADSIVSLDGNDSLEER